MPPSFDYAVIRVVPHVERQEFINAGVLLFCRTRRFLRARIALDRNRVQCFAPDLDLESLEHNLDLLERIARGHRSAGPIAELPPAERWHWLTAPRSTVVQMSPAHSGLCDDLDQALERLTAMMVPGIGEEK